MTPPTRFHLGGELDAATMRPTGSPLLYDPDHLTTHGVCFGMTGSGKTGACIVLLEEAMRAGIPSLILDLKGDVADLALTFPSLAPADFEPWIDPAEAARQGTTSAALAAATAQRWREGLAREGLGGESITSMRSRCEIAVFTPGSGAGRPVNVLGGFAPPAGSWEDDPEAMRSSLTQSVAALMDLSGIDGDTATSPEAIFLATSFERAWQRGETVTLERLIRDLSDPPIARLGVMDLDDILPKAKRTAAAVALNGLVAAPSFAAWTRGTPLDPAALLRSDDGRPRASIFYLAHLSDRERSFFTASLFASVVSWMRAQGGSPSLRALIYMDEIFGYLPPHPANPPSKEPLLTLLKQARAFGVGVMLATQNPVDVDYKGLANAGTWLLGKMQTEQDRERLMDGMVGSAGADRGALQRALAALPPRSFLLHDAREGRLRAFSTRWAMSYLRGPLTKEEIRRLPEGRSPASAAASSPPPAAAVSAPVSTSTVRPPAASPSTAVSAAVAPADQLAVRPKIADGVPERFHVTGTGGAPLSPYLLGTVRYVVEDAKAGVREERRKALAVSAEAASLSPDWGLAKEIAADMSPGSAPPPTAAYRAVPGSWQKSAIFKQGATSLKGWIAANETLDLLTNEALKISGKARESREEFTSRCRQEAARRRDDEMRAYQARIEGKVRRLQSKLEKEEADVVRDEQDAQMRKTQEAIGIGGAVLGALFGRRGGITSAVLGAGSRRRMTARAGMQVDKSKQEAEAARAELDAFEQEARAVLAEIEKRWEEVARRIDEAQLRPKKTAIEIVELGVLWTDALP